MTLHEATEKFVSEMDAIPTEMIERLWEQSPDEWEEVTVPDGVSEPYDVFPMWGTMWSFHDSIDDWWLEECDGIRLMSECGFRIYYHQAWGYFFGIDGAGYDFYAEHWEPLYKVRGLHWHDEEDKSDDSKS